ncbi:HEAT repeat domain-containing protein [Lusitaniella coriacea LEGE 07157]|uniref:HEAT repeat domain-containing protein n=1 Tax=Lusitaniella coriacea LEGE 07157 TaxID=945747 RepID=A0A8J7IUT3_9CYAN|nr:HEAT repeat domain-containing protein [Lusitaniella coriacea]MBE9116758.1 HEAT repeat domain-containing protein [Lusitaniella coriacea LEGE 07157]
MLRTLRQTLNKSRFLLFSLTLLLTLLLALPWVSAQEPPKPKPWQINGILAALDDGYLEVRGYALRKLAEYETEDLLPLLEQPEEIAQKAATLLKDESVDSNIRSSAARVLGDLGEAGAKYAPDILNFLKDESVDSNIRSSAARVLGDLGEAGAKYAPDILNFLKDESVDSNIRSRAAWAFGNLGEARAKYAPDILNFLKDESVDSNVRGSAAWALGNLGEAGAKYAPDILNFLKDESVDSNVRGSAALAFGNLGEAGAKYAPDILNFLKDESVDSNVRGSAALAFGNLGEAGAKYAPDILNFLKDESVDSNIRSSAAGALGKIAQLQLDEVVIVLDFLYDEGKSGVAQWRFQTYFLGGGTEEVKALLTWLGEPKTVPEKLNHEDGVKTLKVFKRAWKASPDLEGVRDDLAQKIATVAAYKKVSWQPKDIVLLQTHYNNLKATHPNSANSVLRVIENLEFWKWFFRARNLILAHAFLWLLLIFAYPKYPQIQAIFFWNPWVRKFLGFGYVGFLLAWVPFLRRKLFEPFKPSLLADAKLDDFESRAYFPESKVAFKGEIQPITQVLPKIEGQIILVGDSGLGKSMFLRHLANTAPRIAVYLPARKCENGVIAAIQAKLHGQAQDEAFLKNLIYSGAIDICIDGLNEVTADTRAKISQFVESYFRGNIIMTTQPLEWIPPSTAKTYTLQSLQPQQIEQFLRSRSQLLPQNAPVRDAAYERACKTYLSKMLDPQQSPEELAAAQHILSNPMDLTLVAQMLSQGKSPDLFHLQEQQYTLMAAEFHEERGYDFPLKKFSQAVYEMRLKDENTLPAEEFYPELKSLEDEKYKMVISRQWQNTEGEPHQEWYFRHDKIMDFFLVQNFLGDGNEVEARLVDCMGDPRFRGAYFLLALLLELDAAKDLREKLIQYAADTKDHTVSDTFVQLLRTR